MHTSPAVVMMFLSLLVRRFFQEDKFGNVIGKSALSKLLVTALPHKQCLGYETLMASTNRSVFTIWDHCDSLLHRTEDPRCCMTSWIWVNIGSDNGLLPDHADGTKPFSETVLTCNQCVHGVNQGAI